MEKRKCKTCEYYEAVEYQKYGACCFDIPQVTSNNGAGGFPKVTENRFCSHWEPIWHDNPIIAEAWKQFKMAHKLITAGENEGEN